MEKKSTALWKKLFSSITLFALLATMVPMVDAADIVDDPNITDAKVVYKFGPTGKGTHTIAWTNTNDANVESLDIGWWMYARDGTPVKQQIFYGVMGRTGSLRDNKLSYANIGELDPSLKTKFEIKTCYKNFGNCYYEHVYYDPQSPIAGSDSLQPTSVTATLEGTTGAKVNFNLPRADVDKFLVTVENLSGQQISSREHSAGDKNSTSHQVVYSDLGTGLLSGVKFKVSAMYAWHADYSPSRTSNEIKSTAGSSTTSLNAPQGLSVEYFPSGVPNEPNSSNFKLSWQAPASGTPSGYKISVLKRDRGTTGGFVSDSQPGIISANARTTSFLVNQVDFKDLKFELRALYDSNTKESTAIEKYYPDYGNSTQAGAAPVAGASNCVDNKTCTLNIAETQDSDELLVGLSVAGRNDLSIRMFAENDDANAKALIAKNPKLTEPVGIALVPKAATGTHASTYKVALTGMEVGKTYKFKTTAIKRATNSTSPSYTEWPDATVSKVTSFTVRSPQVVSTKPWEYKSYSVANGNARVAFNTSNIISDFSIRVFPQNDNAKALKSQNTWLDSAAGFEINNPVVEIKGIESGKEYTFRANIVKADRLNIPATTEFAKWPDFPSSGELNFTVNGSNSTSTSNQVECVLYTMAGLGNFKWNKDDGQKVQYEFQFSGGTGYRAAVYKITSGSPASTPTINWTDQTQSVWQVTLDPATTYEAHWYDKSTYDAIQRETDATKKSDLERAYKRTYRFTTASLNTNGGNVTTGGTTQPASSLCTSENRGNCYQLTLNGTPQTNTDGSPKTLWDLFPAGMSREEINKLINSAPKGDTMGKFPEVTYKGNKLAHVKWDNNDFLGWVQWDPNKARPDGNLGDWVSFKPYSPTAECPLQDRNYQIRYTKVGANPNYQAIIDKLKIDRNSDDGLKSWPFTIRESEIANGYELTLPTDDDYAIAVTRYCGNRAADPSPFVIVGKGKTTGQTYGQTTFQQIPATQQAVAVTLGAQCNIASVNGQSVAIAKPATPVNVRYLLPRDVAKVKLDGKWIDNPTVLGVHFLTATNAETWEFATAFIKDESGTAYRLSDYYTNVNLKKEEAQIQVKQTDGTLKEWRGIPLVGLAPGTYKLGLAYTQDGVMSDPGWLDQPLIVSPYTPPSTVTDDDLKIAPTEAKIEFDESTGHALLKWLPVGIENITGYEIGEKDRNGQFSARYYVSAERYRDFGLKSGLEGTRPPTELAIQLSRRGSADQNGVIEDPADAYKFFVRPTYFVYKRVNDLGGTKVPEDQNVVVDENGKKVGFDTGAGVAAKISKYGAEVAFPEKPYPVLRPKYVPLNDMPAVEGNQCNILAQVEGTTSAKPYELSMDNPQDVKVTMLLPKSTMAALGGAIEFLPKYYLSNGTSNQTGIAPEDSEFKTPDCAMVTFRDGFIGNQTNSNPDDDFTVDNARWTDTPVEVEQDVLLTPTELNKVESERETIFSQKWNALSLTEKRTHLRRAGVYADPNQYGYNGVPVYRSSNRSVTQTAAQKAQFVRDQVMGYIAARNVQNDTCNFTIPASQLKQGVNTFTLQGFIKDSHNEMVNARMTSGLQEIMYKCTDVPPQLKIGVAVRTKPTISNPTVTPDDAQLALSTEREPNVIPTSRAVLNYSINDTTDSSVTCKIKDSTTNTPTTIPCNKGPNTYLHNLSGAGGERTITLYVENGLGEMTEWSQKIVYENQQPAAIFSNLPNGQVDGTSANISVACDTTKGECKKLDYIIQDTQVPSVILKQLQPITCSNGSQCNVTVNRGSNYTKYVYAVMTTRGGMVVYSEPQKIEFKQPLPSAENPDTDGPGTLPDVGGPGTTPIDTDTDIPAGAPTIEVIWGSAGSYTKLASIAPTVKVNHTADSVLVVLYNGSTEVTRKTINKSEYNTNVTLGNLGLTPNAANVLKVEANATGSTTKSQATATINHDAMQPAVTIDPVQTTASGKVFTWNFKVTDSSPVTQVKVKAKNVLTGDKFEETLSLQSNGQYTFSVGNGTKKLVPGHAYMLDVFAIDAAGNGGLTPNASSAESTVSMTKAEEKNPLLQLLYIGDKIFDGELVNVRMAKGSYVYIANDVPKGANLLLSDIVERGYANTNGQKASKLPSGTYQVEVSSKANASQKYTFSVTITPYYYSPDGDLNGDGRVGLIDQIIKVHGESIAKYNDKDSNSELQTEFGKLVTAIQNAVNENIRLFYRL